MLKQLRLKKDVAKEKIAQDFKPVEIHEDKPERVFDFMQEDLAAGAAGERQVFVNGDKVSVTLNGTIVSTEAGKLSIKADDISAVKIEPEVSPEASPEVKPKAKMSEEPLSMTEALKKVKRGKVMSTTPP